MRCQTPILAARCLILISVALAEINSVDARGSPANKSVAQVSSVAAAMHAEPYHLHFDESSDILCVPETFGLKETFWPAWFGKPQFNPNMHCVRLQRSLLRSS